jgi:hypothetical protein
MNSRAKPRYAFGEWMPAINIENYGNIRLKAAKVERIKDLLEKSEKHRIS